MNNPEFCKKCDSYVNVRIEIKGTHNTAYCVECDSYIKHVPKNQSELKFYFGKYKNQIISKCDDEQYLYWVLKNVSLKDNYELVVFNRLEELRK